MCDKRNKFCYVCGLFVDAQHRLKLETNTTVVSAYNAFFNRTYSLSQWFEPEYVCTNCSIVLKRWKAGKAGAPRMAFSTPMIWHPILYHRPVNCYFCATNVEGHHYKTRKNITYANVPSVTKPTLLDDTVEPAKRSDQSSHGESSSGEKSDVEFLPPKTKSTERHLISNADMHDIVRDYKLSQRAAESLASRFKQWNAVEDDFKITFGRTEKRLFFEQLFERDDVDNKLVYCTDIAALFTAFGHDHKPDQWRLFIDGSSKSKCFF